MAFKFRLNSEVLFYRTATVNFNAYIQALSKDPFWSEWQSNIDANKIFPGREETLSAAIEAIVNWAFCIEACFNMGLAKIAVKLEGWESFSALDKKYIELERGNVRTKIDTLAQHFPNLFQYGLDEKIKHLFFARNRFVHFKDRGFFTTDGLIDDMFKYLSLEDMLNFHQSVELLLSRMLAQKAINDDIRRADIPIIGEGDICFDDQRTLLQSIWFAMRHPFWYIFKRIPDKMVHRRYSKHLLSYIEARLSKISA